ncbi:unnamed protein product [Symbiodinium natans]|uniref:Uncharacterized protein n=1 Tax=Symbiodinium natans TaxID=878477 RepID=A0A812JJW6_9DINO|nr:unnamed protein product [Symbiodinium natans]
MLAIPCGHGLGTALMQPQVTQVTTRSCVTAPWSSRSLRGAGLALSAGGHGVSGRRSALSAWLCGLGCAAGCASIPRRARASTGSSEAVLCKNADLSVAFPVWKGDQTREATEELLQESGGSAAAGAEADWAGLWRVSYAPHIRTLGSLALTQLDVYYDIACTSAGASPEIRSFVRFEAGGPQGPFGSGWLNAAGTLSTIGTDEVEVNFSEFWIDFNTRLPRPALEDADRLGSDLAKVFFVRDLSRFPVRSLNLQTGVTVFRFPPLGVEISACRVGASGAALRPLSDAR